MTTSDMRSDLLSLRPLHITEPLSVIIKNMKKSHIVIYIAFIVSICSCYSQVEQIEFPEETDNLKTENHKRIKGTRLFIEYSNDYKYNPLLTRIQKGKQQYLQFFETKSVNFTEVLNEQYTKSELEKKGIDSEDFQYITIQDYKGIFSIGPSKGENEEKIVLNFGDDTFTVVIGGVINKDNTNGKKELIDVLQTIHFDKNFELNPLELSNFDIDLNITGFHYNATISNIYTFSADKRGQLNETNSTINDFMVASLPEQTIPELKAIATDILFNFEIDETMLIIENKDFKNEIINGYQALVAESPISTEEKKGILYLAAIQGEETSIVFLGTAYKNAEEMIRKYKQTVTKMKFKENY